MTIYFLLVNHAIKIQMCILQTFINVHDIMHQGNTFLIISLNPIFTKTTIHVGVHIHVIDSSDIMVFDKDIKVLIKSIVLATKPRSFLKSIAMHVGEHLTFLQRILISHNSSCLRGSKLSDVLK